MIDGAQRSKFDDKEVVFARKIADTRWGISSAVELRRHAVVDGHVRRGDDDQGSYGMVDGINKY